MFKLFTTLIKGLAIFSIFGPLWVLIHGDEDEWY